MRHSVDDYLAYANIAYVQIWKRAIAESEEKLSEMKVIVSEKTTHQQRLLDKLQQYVRVHDNMVQRAAAAAAARVDNKAEDTGTLDDLSARLATTINTLKSITLNNVQVSYYLSYSCSLYIKNSLYTVYIWVDRWCSG